MLSPKADISIKKRLNNHLSNILGIMEIEQTVRKMKKKLKY